MNTERANFARESAPPFADLFHLIIFWNILAKNFFEILFIFRRNLTTNILISILKVVKMLFPHEYFTKKFRFFFSSKRQPSLQCHFSLFNIRTINTHLSDHIVIINKVMVNLLTANFSIFMTSLLISIVWPLPISKFTYSLMRWAQASTTR